MSNKPLTTKEQLMQLKAMTVRMGVIHEAQALQLKMWPLLIPDVSKAVSKVDVETKSVIMTCETKKGKKFKKTDQIDLLCKNIEEWTRAILWEETVVSIIVNGETIYGVDYEREASTAT